jgi:hypothetical protein
VNIASSNTSSREVATTTCTELEIHGHYLQRFFYGHVLNDRIARENLRTARYSMTRTSPFQPRRAYSELRNANNSCFSVGLSSWKRWAAWSASLLCLSMAFSRVNDLRSCM